VTGAPIARLGGHLGEAERTMQEIGGSKPTVLRIMPPMALCMCLRTIVARPQGNAVFPRTCPMPLLPRRDTPHGVPPDGGAPRATTVLVVDPDAIMRQFLRRLFERHGLEVLLTASPEQALRILAGAEGTVHAVVHADALRFGAHDGEGGHLRRLAPTVPVVRFGGAAPGGRDGRSASRSNGQRPDQGPFDAEALVRAVLGAIARAG
jgi:CheY-like chemotaxis protein